MRGIMLDSYLNHCILLQINKLHRKRKWHLPNISLNDLVRFSASNRGQCLTLGHCNDACEQGFHVVGL